MSAITFDTHQIIKKLEAGGVSSEQAEAIVDAIKITQESAELATKTDIKIAISELKADMLKWIFAMLAGQLALILAVLPKLIGQ